MFLSLGCGQVGAAIFLDIAFLMLLLAIFDYIVLAVLGAI